MELLQFIFATIGAISITGLLALAINEMTARKQAKATVNQITDKIMSSGTRAHPYPDSELPAQLIYDGVYMTMRYRNGFACRVKMANITTLLQKYGSPELKHEKIPNHVRYLRYFVTYIKKEKDSIIDPLNGVLFELPNVPRIHIGTRVKVDDNGSVFTISGSANVETNRFGIPIKIEISDPATHKWASKFPEYAELWTKDAFESVARAYERANERSIDYMAPDYKPQDNYQREALPYEHIAEMICSNDKFMLDLVNGYRPKFVIMMDKEELEATYNIVNPLDYDNDYIQGIRSAIVATAGASS